MYCKHCGKEISENAKFCDCCGNPVAEEINVSPVVEIEEPKKKKKKKHPILGTIILIFGIFIIIAAIGGGSDDPKKVEGNSESAATNAETKEDIPFTVGDTVEMRDIYVTLNSITESKGENYNTPEDGNVYIICEFTIENKNKSDLAVSSLMCFHAYADDYATNMSLTATIMSDKGQLDGTVASEKKINGVIGYEIPENWSTFEISFVPAGWSNGFNFVCTK